MHFSNDLDVITVSILVVAADAVFRWAWLLYCYIRREKAWRAHKKERNKETL